MFRSFLQSTAAGVIVTGLSTGMGEAQDARAEVIADLDLPIGTVRVYEDQGTKTLIIEECAADEASQRVICKLDVIAHQPKMALKLEHIYRVDGVGLSIDSKTMLVRKKDSFDNELYEDRLLSVLPFDETSSPIMTSQAAANFGFQNAFDGAINVIVRDNNNLDVNSYVGVSAIRGFALSSHWIFGETVSGSVRPIAFINGTVITPTDLEPASRAEWTKGDTRRYETLEKQPGLHHP